MYSLNNTSIIEGACRRQQPSQIVVPPGYYDTRVACTFTPLPINRFCS